MGFFSKKTFICEKCGKEFQARLTFGIHICDECWDRQNNKKDNVKGYVDYANKACWDEYTEEQLDAIAAHRDAILEKYRVEQGISRAELAEASANYKRLSHDDVWSVVIRSMLSSVDGTLGAAYTDDFFVPTAFEKTIVDAQDVFAVAYRTDHKLKASLCEEAILCAVFTNDPYIPAFPMVFVGNLGFFELKSKGGRLGVRQFFEEHCPNLTYPVQELKQLNKQIKAEGSVRGKIDPIFMRAKIENALVSGNIFDTKKLKNELSDSSAELLDAYGYIQAGEINQILKMDRRSNGQYWDRQFRQIRNELQHARFEPEQG